MSLKLLAGVGRTGTYSLKLAVNRLGFGPCHRLEEVLMNMATQVCLPLCAGARGAVSTHQRSRRILGLRLGQELTHTRRSLLSNPGGDPWAGD